MSRITVNTIKSTFNINETYDIVNAMRGSNQAFKDYVPLASKDNIAEIGAAILGDQPTLNHFVNTLINRIGLTIVKSATLVNDFKKFKKGKMPEGYTIQEVFVDITQAHKYDPETAEKEVYKREIPNVKVLYHEENRREFYKQSVQEQDLKKAFLSWSNFESFVSNVINAMYNSNEVDEYKYFKLLIDNYYSKGLFTMVQVDKPDSETKTREFIKKVRATITKMTLGQGTRNYNSLAVHTRSQMEDLHLFIDADLNAELDVDILAKAFNLDRTTFMANVTIIDGFASEGLEAVLVDKDFFMVYDNVYQTKVKENEEGLYHNYWLHVWQTLSVSRFANAVAFVSGEVAPVTQVIIDPVIIALKQGRSHQLKAYVRQNDKKKYNVSWSVEGSDGHTIASDTSVDNEGKVTIGETQLGEIKVIAKVSYEKETVGEEGEPTTETVEVKGESIVTIIEESGF